MSILIKGMEMPTSPVLFCIYPDGKVFADLEGNWREYKAVPVPPHGRLIDADAIPYNKIMIEDDDFYYGITQPYIERMPTIIPASEVET